MKWLGAAWCLFVSMALASPIRAEGLLYQLPEDREWAKFEVVGNAVDPNGNQTTLTGDITISSVGMVEVEGNQCRWIEIQFDGKRNGEPFVTVDKLLIPAKYLAKGEEPLAHVQKAWRKHSAINGGTAQQLEDVANPESRGGKYVRGGQLQLLLHGPYENPQKLDKSVVESKLGKLECDGISTEEGSPRSLSTIAIRLHKDAPFGVVSFDIDTKLVQNGQAMGMMTTKATLSDFGKNAKSSIPEAS